jgi:hypothetical protein
MNLLIKIIFIVIECNILFFGVYYKYGYHLDSKRILIIYVYFSKSKNVKCFIL